MTIAANFQRSFIGEPTSYLPAQRAMFEFPLSADVDVLRWRRMGASWQAVAKNFGCSVDRVRRQYDPTYTPLHAPAKPVAAPKAARGKAQAVCQRTTFVRRTAPNVRRQQIERVLMALAVRPRTSRDVAEATKLAPTVASEVLQAMKCSRLVQGRPCGAGNGNEWRLTDDGLARVAELKGAAGA